MVRGVELLVRLVLGLMVCLGALLPGAGPFEYRLAYADGIISYYTDGPKLCIEPRSGRAFTYSTCDGASCSEQSSPVLVDPLPGDATLDGVVGAADFNAVRDNYGRSAP